MVISGKNTCFYDFTVKNGESLIFLGFCLHAHNAFYIKSRVWLQTKIWQFFFDLEIFLPNSWVFIPDKVPPKLYLRDLNFLPNFDKDLFVELRHKAYNFWGKFLLLNFANKSLPKFQKKFTDKVLLKNYTPYLSISFQILVKIYL